MPAPNLPTLFDFEGQFENAALELLTAVVINAYASGGDQQTAVENCGIQFTLGPAVEGKFAQLPKPASWPVGEPAPQEYFIYDATLEFRAEVPRDDPAPTIEGVSSKLGEIRGKLREEMMQCVRPFTETNLPYYKVSRIRPAGSSYGENQQRNTDVAFIRYTLRLEIRPDAWPTWVES
jgi:hypothetical protein